MAERPWIPMSVEVLRDMGHPAYAYLTPDVSSYMSPFPYFDLFPTWTRAEDALNAARRRLRDAWTVLRSGLPEEDL